MEAVRDIQTPSNPKCILLQSIVGKKVIIKKDTQVRCNIHEDERVEQVVCTVFQEEPGHELPRDGDLARRDALVQSQC